MVHSEFDRDLVAEHWPVGGKPVTVIHHGPYDHLTEQGSVRAGRGHAEREILREAPDDVCNVLFFGTIRPYKGLEDLVDAFDSLAAPTRSAATGSRSSERRGKAGRFRPRRSSGPDGATGSPS